MRRALLLLIGLSLLAVPVLSPAAEPVKIKFAHLGRPDPFVEPAQGGVLNFKYLVEKNSGGRYEVEVYPAGTLGKEVDLLEATKSNVVQMFSASMVALHRVFPPAMTMMTPYLFRNEAVAQAVVDGPYAQKLLDAFGEKTGMKGITVMDLGFSAITNSVRPLRKPEDFKGIKFRGMDTLQVTMFESLGGSAIPIAWPEVYTSLQTGVVQGQTNPPSIIAGFKINEVQKFMSLTNSQYGYQFWVCNKKFWDDLPPEDKLIIRDAAIMGKMTSRGLGLLVDQKAVSDVQKAGTQVNGLTAAEIGVFQKIATPACLNWLRTQMEPQWVDDLIKAVEEAEKKLGYAK